MSEIKGKTGLTVHVSISGNTVLPEELIEVMTDDMKVAILEIIESAEGAYETLNNLVSQLSNTKSLAKYMGVMDNPSDPVDIETKRKVRDDTLQMLERSNYPHDVLAAISASDGIIDEWGATVGCTCNHCDEVRAENQGMPELLGRIRELEMTSPREGHKGVYRLSRLTLQSIIPVGLAEAVAKYMAYHLSWYNDEDNIYYVPNVKALA